MSAIFVLLFLDKYILYIYTLYLIYRVPKATDATNFDLHLLGAEAG